MKIQKFDTYQIVFLWHASDIRFTFQRLIILASFSFFQNLAVSDLLFVIICIPPTALDYAIDWPLGDICCRIMQYIIHVTCCTSVLTLVSERGIFQIFWKVHSWQKFKIVLVRKPERKLYSFHAEKLSKHNFWEW